MAKEYRIGALWIGGDLSFLEQLCLKSFVDAGQHVVLYTYEPVGNAPAGVELADANEILPQTAFLRHVRTGSVAPHSDRFRYHMLARHDDMIWADTDAYCVRPFTTENGHFHGWESRHKVGNGVLGLPPDSATLAGLLEFTADEYGIPEWLPEDEQADLRARRDAGTPVHTTEMAWGSWGPAALTHYLHKTGEIRHSFATAALFPFHFRDRRLMLRPGYDIAQHVTDATFSIHFYGRRMRARILEREPDAIPRPRTIIGKLLKLHGIDPRLAPLPRKAVVESDSEDEG